MYELELVHKQGANMEERSHGREVTEIDQIPRSDIEAGIKLHAEDPVTTVAVIGVGVIGQVTCAELALCGMNVVAVDRNARVAAELSDTVAHACDDAVRHGMLTAVQVEEVRHRCRGTTNIGEAVHGAQIVLECVTEVLEVKAAVIREAQRHAAEGVPICSATLNLNLDTIAAELELGDTDGAPAALLGVRFLHPGVLIDHVEVTRASRTADRPWCYMLGWLAALHKSPFLGPNLQHLYRDEVLPLQIAPEDGVDVPAPRHDVPGSDWRAEGDLPT